MLEWLDQRLPNFFERDPNLSLVNTPRLSSFLISAYQLYTLFSRTYTIDRQAVVTLKVHNSGLYRLFLTIRYPCLGFDSFEKHWAG